MPFFFFLILVINVYANTIEIKSTFKDLSRVCIANKKSDSLNIKLKIDYDRKVCIYFKDYSGTLESKCDYQEVEINPDDLRHNVVYYITELYSSNEDYEYKLTIKGDNILAGECPTDTLAKVANTSADNLASALSFAGAGAGLIALYFVLNALKEEKDDAELGS